MIDKKKNKKIRTIFIISGVVLFILAFLIYVVGVKMRFYIGEELDTTIAPLDSSFSVIDGQSVDMTYTVENRNFPQCTTTCNITFTDVSSGKLLDQKTDVFSHQEIHSYSYNVTSPDHGSGQLLFLFEATCHNIRSGICFTDESQRYDSSLLSVNYDLPPEEHQKKEEVQQHLGIVLPLIDSVSVLVQQNVKFVLQAPASIEKDEIIQIIIAQREMIQQLQKSRDLLLNMWKQERYDDASSHLLDINELNLLHNNSQWVQHSLLDLIHQRNDVHTGMNDIINEKELFSQAVTHAEQEYPLSIQSLPNASSTFFSDYSLLKSDASINQTLVVSDVNTSLAILPSLLQEFQQRSTDGLLLLAFGHEELHGKQNTSVSNISSFNCTDLRALHNEFFVSNNASLSFRVHHYPWSVGNDSFDALLDDVRSTMEYTAFMQTQHVASERNVSMSFTILPASFSSSFPTEDLFAMTIINTSRFDDYLIENCRGTGINQSVPERSRQILEMNTLPSFNTTLPHLQETTPTNFSQNNPLCCVNNECHSCCPDCEKKSPPILFIHGHLFNDANSPESAMHAFSAIQRLLERDGFVNGGELNLTPTALQSDFGRSGAPVTLRSTYYYIRTFGVGSYSVSLQTSERVENYALRLQEIIGIVKARTGSDKVIIVAHSMGGLVARDYVSLFGANDIDKIITINTPHHGVSGKVKKYCTLLGASKECEDMGEGSVFLQRLNAQPQSVPLYDIKTTGCPMENNADGDGIVTSESAELKWAKNYEIKGTCTDSLQSSLHTDVLDPEHYPELYELLKKILKEG